MSLLRVSKNVKLLSEREDMSVLRVRKYDSTLLKES